MLKRIMLVLLLLSVAADRNVPAAQTEVQPKNDLSVPLVVQGRVIATESNGLVTLKTPDVYPGGKGLRPQWVMNGPRFKIDVSHARMFYPDGRRADKRPLAVGDRVVVVLKKTNGEPSTPGALELVYSASIVERLVAGDRVTLD